MRMDPPMFQELIQCQGDRITKQDIWFQKALEPGLKLAIMLRHLAAGDNYHSQMYSFRVASTTISLILREVCNAIIEEFAAEVLDCLTLAQEWKRVADQFGDCWQMPHAIGAIDGKHVSIKCPKRSSSLFYNYKGFYYIILSALVDADYKFLWVDVGQNGSSPDALIFNQYVLKESIDDRTIGLPPADPRPDDHRPMPYFIFDDAFALKTWLIKPFSQRNMSYEQRIFNYCLAPDELWRMCLAYLLTISSVC